MQNILVTGANRGIGLALTRRLLELGHRVFAGARKPAQANALRDFPSAELARLTVLELDVTSDQSVQHALGEVRRVTPQLDVVVNMAGVSPHPHDARLDTVELTTVSNTFLINVIGPLRVAQAFAPLL